MLKKRCQEAVKDAELFTESKEAFEQFDRAFKEALGSDLNTSSALTVLYDVLKSDADPAAKKDLLIHFDTVLGLDLLKEDQEEEKKVDEATERLILEMIEKRHAAKKEKNYAEADRIRNELLDKGIVLKDTREGTLWEIR